MTTREVRAQISDIEARRALLEHWTGELTRRREHYLLAGTERALWTVQIIENGVGPNGSRPDDQSLAGFDRGLPGLRQAEREIALLRERRKLLAARLPSKADVEALTREAAAQAVTIGAMARDIDNGVAAARTALHDVADLMLSVVEKVAAMDQANHALDAICLDGAIRRPPTPHRDAPLVEIAQPLAALLAHHFAGGRPVPPDAHVRGAIVDARRSVTPVDQEHCGRV